MARQLATERATLVRISAAMTSAAAAVPMSAHAHGCVMGCGWHTNGQINALMAAEVITR